MIGDSKKGNVALGVVVMIVVICIFAVVSLLGKYLINEMNTAIQDDDDIPTQGKDIMASQNTNFGSVFDLLIVSALIMFWAMLLISSWLIDSHPIFFFISVILFIFLFGFAAVMGNVYEEISTDADIATVTPQFPLTNFIMSHFLATIIIVAFSAGTVLYAKTRT